MNAPMSLDRLEAFLAVAEAGSFAVAAARLGVDRSAVSRRIAALEAGLGARVFNRTTRRVVLTSDGTALRDRAGPLLRQLQDAMAALASREVPPAGALRLGIPSGTFAGFFSEILLGFCARHPALELDLRVSAGGADFVAQGLDAAIWAAPGRLVDSSLVAVRVVDLEHRAYASPAYLARAGRPGSPAEAAEHDWVVQLGQRFTRPFLAPRRPPRIRIDQPHLLLNAVRAGLGLGLLPSMVAQEHLLTGQLACALPGVTARSGAVWFVHAGGRAVTPKVRALREWILAHPPLPWEAEAATAPRGRAR